MNNKNPLVTADLASFYKPFYVHTIKEGTGWFFFIPYWDGPFPDDGEHMLTGPYASEADAWMEIHTCQKNVRKSRS